MKDVLIVEDDEQTLDALCKVIAIEGHRSRGSRTAQSAMLEIDEQCPEILLSDWDLGGDATGVDVVSHAIKCDPDVYVVMFSGNYLQSLKLATSGLPIRRYISKPFTLSDIRAIFSQMS